MIGKPKGRGSDSETPPKRPRRERVPRAERRLKKGEPLEVELSVSFKFGEAPDDLVTPINARKVPMVDSVFRNRDRIMRQFAALLFKTGLSSPKVVGRMLPVTLRPKK